MGLSSVQRSATRPQTVAGGSRERWNRIIKIAKMSGTRDLADCFSLPPSLIDRETGQILFPSLTRRHLLPLVGIPIPKALNTLTRVETDVSIVWMKKLLRVNDLPKTASKGTSGIKLLLIPQDKLFPSVSLVPITLCIVEYLMVHLALSYPVSH